MSQEGLMPSAQPLVLGWLVLTEDLRDKNVVKGQKPGEDVVIDDFMTRIGEKV